MLFPRLHSEEVAPSEQLYGDSLQPHPYPPLAKGRAGEGLQGPHSISTKNCRFRRHKRTIFFTIHTGRNYMEKFLELYVVLENKPGTAGELTRILKKKNIAIYAIAMFIDFARMHVSNPEKAVSILHDHNYQAELREALQVILPNRRGALMEVTQKLGNAGINIDYLYGAMQEKQKKGVLILEVDQPDLALDLFKNHSF